MDIIPNERGFRVRLDVSMVKTVKHSCRNHDSRTHTRVYCYPYTFARSRSSSSINQRASLASTRSTQWNSNDMAERRCVGTVQIWKCPTCSALKSSYCQVDTLISARFSANMTVTVIVEEYLRSWQEFFCFEHLTRS